MRKREEKTEGILLLGILIISSLLFASFTLADPTGPTSINITSNETATTSAAQKINISGGYIAKINVTAVTQNPRWKAFIGWIDGRFTLDDASGSTIYDWTLSSVGGEVYATRNSSSIDWSGVQCANTTQVEAEDTALEHAGEDKINSTFSGTNSITFVTAGETISAGACRAINTYVNNVTQGTEFEEVILYASPSIVFASVLEEDETGYDGSTYDFQMIVPENGNETWSGATAYYLYVELS